MKDVNICHSDISFSSLLLSHNFNVFWLIIVVMCFQFIYCAKCLTQNISYIFFRLRYFNWGNKALWCSNGVLLKCHPIVVDVNNWVKWLLGRKTVTDQNRLKFQYGCSSRYRQDIHSQRCQLWNWHFKESQWHAEEATIHRHNSVSWTGGVPLP